LDNNKFTFIYQFHTTKTKSRTEQSCDPIPIFTDDLTPLLLPPRAAATPCSATRGTTRAWPSRRRSATRTTCAACCRRRWRRRSSRRRR
jgi:hypothetical protein